MLRLTLVAAGFLLFSITGKADTVYVWRDAQGVVQYSDTPQGKGARDVKTLRRSTDGSGVSTPGDRGATARGGAPTAGGGTSTGRGRLLRTLPSSGTTAASSATSPSTSSSSGTTAASSGTTPDAPSLSGTTVAGGGTSPSTPPPSVTTGAGTSAVSFISGNWKQAFFCTFANSPTDCGFRVQEKVPGRATIVNLGRDGGTALRLHTEPGDNNVAGSGTMERNDVYLTQGDSDGYEGREQVWELSVLFPDDFAFPKWHRYALAGFHHTGSTGQGNFTLGFERGATDSSPGILGFQLYGGATVNSGSVKVQLWPATEIQRNVWYDFVYHIRWSSGPDGFFDAWVDGVKKLSHRGPTLYAGQGAYFKLANYHNPICDPYPACIGPSNPASSVIYDRVIRHDLQ